MRVIVCENYDEMSAVAADFVKSQIILKPNSVLGLATGSTPVGMYEKLTEKKLDFSNVTTFNLDDYYKLAQSDPQSYHTFMRDNLYDKVNLKSENTFIPNSDAKNPDEECKKYDEKIAEKGGIDLQILGIGQNGHIGFNEPGESLTAGTHVVDLAEDTIVANSRFFKTRDEVPKRALTMGIATIMQARKVVLLASGTAKAFAVSEILKGKITTQIPATILLAHPDFTLICDKEAAGK